MKFGAYVFPDTFYVDKSPFDRQVPTAKLPRNDGSRLAQGYLTERKFSVKGGLADMGEPIPTSGDPLRVQLDTLKAAIAGVQPFYMDAGGDRYYRDCQAGNYSETMEATWQGRIADIEFEIVAGDPLAYSTTLSSVSHAVAAGAASVTATTNGTAYALPVISLTAGTTPVVNATLTNAATGEQMQIVAAALAPGQILVLDSIYRQATVGALDALRYVDGTFLRLVPGANVLTLAVQSGVLTNLQVAFRDRWY